MPNPFIFHILLTQPLYEAALKEMCDFTIGRCQFRPEAGQRTAERMLDTTIRIVYDSIRRGPASPLKLDLGQSTDKGFLDSIREIREHNKNIRMDHRNSLVEIVKGLGTDALSQVVAECIVDELFDINEKMAHAA